ncbi:MAG: L-ribulose-5-phosphate 3-epimerase [Abditibacteriota bacterium]|nr:L-ribulose-5-phosphate 3-epimerase [Abditibacteriota bacterium]
MPFFGPAEISDAAAVERLGKNLRLLAPAAEAANVTLAIEHTLRGDEAAKVLSSVASSHIGAYWDMANCMSLGYDPLAEIAMLRSHIVRVHAKEFTGEGIVGRRQAGSYPGLNVVPFGQGDVPLSKVLPALQEVGYKGYITLETGAFGDNKESARAALEVLRSNL